MIAANKTQVTIRVLLFSWCRSVRPKTARPDLRGRPFLYPSACRTRDRPTAHDRLHPILGRNTLQIRPDPLGAGLFHAHWRDVDYVRHCPTLRVGPPLAVSTAVELPPDSAEGAPLPTGRLPQKR